MLRELNINEMEVVSGGGARDEIETTAVIQDGYDNDEGGGGYAGLTLALGLGISAYVGADGAGEGNAGFGIGGSVTIGRSNNTNQAVQDRANVDNTQICTAICLSDLDLNPLDGDWHVSFGAGFFQPLVSGGRSSDKE